MIPWLLAAFALLAVWFGLRNDAFLYHQPVAEVLSVRQVRSTAEVDSNNNHDHQIRQRVRARFLNTNKRGQVVSFNNDYNTSEGIDFPLRSGQQVFLNHGAAGYQLNDAKRDTVTGVLLALVVLLLILFSGKHALVTMVSIALNTVVFYAGIHLELGSHGNGPWYLVVGMALLFTVLTVLFVIGPRSVAVCIASATILATTAAVLIGYAIMVSTGYKGIHIEQVKYVTQNPRLIFFAQIVIGSLGAVLDETSDISVAIFQLPAAAGQRFKAGMAIGRNVMGPLISVLFMIFMADTFTESILWLRNGNTIAYTVSWVMGLGFVQSLISAFGIVLAVPITSGLAALLAGRRQTAK
ncbi:YibE/F family protein [Lacticaseibacillus zhaodongensis]|uniref:YibE/F family protein n=1 Tax=Lacticaseibacillus zhaodongensis TaxID=2668065 RepID=UPI0012D36EC3|nr:YibE/F family protein [Lacticaseibacillus zhaodongensis]